jgi:hypothetical protein
MFERKLSWFVCRPSARRPFARARDGRWRKKWSRSVENALGPEAPFRGLEPYDRRAQIVEWRRGQQFNQQVMNTPLKRAILGSKSIRGDIRFDGRHANQNRVRIHPPGEP